MRTLSILTIALGLSAAACSSDSSTGAGGAGQGGATTSTVTSSTSGSTSTTTTGSTSTGTGSSSSTGTMGGFTLTSTGFVEGAAIPAKFACPSSVSPDLAWSSPPPGTQSYAIVFTDLSNMLLHWAIFDIPAMPTSLAEGVAQVANPPTPAGAKQVKSYDNATFGYLGPCPPSTHTYQFVVYALDVATLPGVTTASTRAQVEAAAKAHQLGSASLSGTFTP